MHKIIILIYLINIFNITNAQVNKTKNWYFGKNAGLKFEDTGIVVLNDGKLSTFEGCSSISDKDGNLLFYSDGLSVWNKYHKVIKNGYGLMGDMSSTQSVLILNHPDNDSLYYIITTPFAYDYNIGMRYSVLNINHNNDSGEITSKNNYLTINSTEKLNAINHANNRDIWVVGHEYGNNAFYSCLLTKDGFVNCPKYSNTGKNISTSQLESQGNIKFSPDGKWLVNTYLYDNSNDYFELFKFNNITGNIVSHFLFPNYASPYGVEFSPNLEYVYISGDNNILQIKLQNLSIINIFNIIKFRIINSLQMAKNGKIYCAIDDSTFLGVINSPDSLGIKCKFKIKGISLNGKKSQFGLPNFNQSYFYTPAINFKYEMECIGNSVKFLGYDTFSASVHQWEVRKLASGSWQTVSNIKNFTHTFTDTGRYEVRYIAAINSIQDTVSKIITIYPKINKQFLGKDTVYSSGTSINKLLKAPYGMHCQLWQDSSGLSTFTADTAGIYICKVTNQAFCVVTDTIVIKECINNLTVPSIYRSRDTLYTYQQLADSFVWFRNNVQYKITKQPYIKLTDTGTYRVEAAKKDHCNRSSNAYRIDKLGIRTINIQDLGIRLYPNPSNEKVFIQSDKQFELTISDITGKILKQVQNDSNYVIEVDLPKGVYLLRFLVNESVTVEKLIVW